MRRLLVVSGSTRSYLRFKSCFFLFSPLPISVHGEFSYEISVRLMVFLTFLLGCSATKQAERQSKIDSLPDSYSTPLSPSEKKIHALSLSDLVSQCRAGSIPPSSIMMAYGKKALLAHKATNCLSDVMFDEALTTPPVANWGPAVDSDAGVNETIRERSLMGVPISIKGVYSLRCLYFATSRTTLTPFSAVTRYN